MIVIRCILGIFTGCAAGTAAAFLALFVITLIMRNDGNDYVVPTWLMLICFGAIPFGVLFGFWKPIRDRNNEVKKERAEQERLSELQRLADAKKLQSEKDLLASLNENGRSQFLSLKETLDSVEEVLDKAEFRFTKRAFGPFWDSIERASVDLLSYPETIDSIAENTRNTNNLSRSIGVRACEPPNRGQPYPDARPVSLRLTKLVELAQRDFQFASILEQRKTNQLLVAGFGSLAASIERMQHSIVDSLESLSDTLEVKLDMLVRATDEQNEKLESLNSRLETISQLADDSLAEDQKQTQMLDNIQRGKKPPEGTFERVTHFRRKGDTRTAHDVDSDG